MNDKDKKGSKNESDKQQEVQFEDIDPNSARPVAHSSPKRMTPSVDLEVDGDIECLADIDVRKECGGAHACIKKEEKHSQKEDLETDDDENLSVPIPNVSDYGDDTMTYDDEDSDEDPDSGSDSEDEEINSEKEKDTAQDKDKAEI